MIEKQFYFMYAWTGGGWLLSQGYPSEKEMLTTMEEKRKKGFTVTDYH